MKVQFNFSSNFHWKVINMSSLNFLGPPPRSPHIFCPGCWRLRTFIDSCCLSLFCLPLGRDVSNHKFEYWSPFFGGAEDSFFEDPESETQDRYWWDNNARHPASAAGWRSRGLRMNSIKMNILKLTSGRNSSDGLSSKNSSLTETGCYIHQGKVFWEWDSRILLEIGRIVHSKKIFYFFWFLKWGLT